MHPGPYICTEWDFGGLPAWLLKEPDLQVRSKDERFLAANARYMKRLGQDVGSLQNSRAAPIIMVQVGNEYGSFGSDHEYMGRIRDSIKTAGFDVPPTTSWHTQWDGAQPPHPHSVGLDLGDARTRAGLRYYPRLESQNGRVKDYRILVRKAAFEGLK